MVTLCTALLALGLGLQEAPDIAVGIRPAAIRAGDRAVVTIRVRSGSGLPEIVDWIPPPGIVVEDVQDRRSAGLGTGGAQGWTFERRLTLTTEVHGTFQLPPVEVVLGGQLYSRESPELTVTAVPLRWARGNRPSSGTGSGQPSAGVNPVLPEGSPPISGEMAEAYPGGGNPYGQWWGYPPYTSLYPWGFPGPIPYWAYPPADSTRSPLDYPWAGQMPYPSLYGPTYYGQVPPGMSPYFWNPTGPNGGWPVPPPGSTPGMGTQGGIPGGSPFMPQGGYHPGHVPWQGNLGVPGQVPGTTGGFGHTLPPIPGGQWPEGMGGGWAETASGDPWWPEIVPELFEFSSWKETMDGSASLAGAVTPKRAFVGQQVTYIATAAMQPGAFLNFDADPEYLPPAPQDFWAVDLPDPLVATPSASGGGVAQSYTFRRALFPLQGGEYLIPPGRVLLPTSNPGSPGELAWDTLAADPIPVTVLPVPAPPDLLQGYAGAIGRYRLEAGITPQRLAVGETAVLVVRVLGVGNVNVLPPPEIPPIYGAEMAPGGDFATVETRDGVVGGVRTFTWLVVPTEPGPIRIGPIIFSYFDPYLGDFGQVAYEELTLEVTEFPGGL